MPYVYNNHTAVDTVDATLALLDKMPRECIEYLAEWWGELFDNLTAQKIEEYIDYDNGDTWDTIDELAEEWGYDDREDMENDGYTILQDAAFDGAIIIL